MLAAIDKIEKLKINMFEEFFKKILTGDASPCFDF